MAGVIPRFTDGPVTCAVAEPVAGGLLVEARAGGLVGVAAAGSVVCLGISTKDATPAASAVSTDGFGNTVVNVATAQVTEYTAVAAEGYYPVTYAAAATFGQLLVCASGGRVTPAAAAPDARTIVGRCWEPNGVTAGAVGLAKIDC